MSTQENLTNINVFPDMATFDAHTTPSIGDDELTLVGNIPAIIETYRNGTSWYRIWSDDWVEQGGFSGTATVTLLVPMNDSNYNLLTGSYRTAATSGSEYHITLPTATSFKMNCDSGNTRWWKVSGYRAIS